MRVQNKISNLKLAHTTVSFIHQHTVLPPESGIILCPPLASRASYSRPLLFSSKKSLNHRRKVRDTREFLFIRASTGMYWREERGGFKSRTHVYMRFKGPDTPGRRSASVGPSVSVCGPSFCRMSRISQHLSQFSMLNRQRSPS